MALSSAAHPKKAQTLNEIDRAFQPSPLIDPEWFKMFYVDSISQARGGRTIDKLRLSLTRSKLGLPQKAFLMGHTGNGKSTELTRLASEINADYLIYRMSSEVDPGSFKPFDVVAAIIFGLVEKAATAPGVGGLRYRLPDDVSKRVIDWFSRIEVKDTQQTSIGAQAEASIGLDGDSWWAKLMGLAAKIRGEMKYGADRKTETVEYRLRRLSSLISLLNEILDLIRGAAADQGKDILVIGEEFDRAGVDPKLVEDLFITYSNIFQEIRCSFIFTIPVSLGYSELNARLPYSPVMLYDTPVFEADNSPHQLGRQALTKLLLARAETSLFAAGQIERLVVAAGGNLRDLFMLVRDSAANASLRGGQSMEDGDITSAIDELRRQVRARLTQSADDKITYQQRVEKLQAVYRGLPDASIPDLVLLSLLRSRSVQEFNGKGRYAVAPLVVDLLKDQEHLPANSPGGTE